jgi:hypothetical protein
MLDSYAGSFRGELEFDLPDTLGEIDGIAQPQAEREHGASRAQTQRRILRPQQRRDFLGRQRHVVGQSAQRSADEFITHIGDEPAEIGTRKFPLRSLPAHIRFLRGGTDAKPGRQGESEVQILF